MSSSPTEPGAPPAELVEVTMPQMGVSVAEGTVVAWPKRPGDWVEKDEAICEISTDKIDTEIPSPAAGRIARILVDVDETVAVGTLLAEIDVSARPGRPHQAERVQGNGASREADRSHVYSPVVRRMAADHGVDLQRVKGTGVGGRVRKKDLVAYVDQRDGDPASATRSEPGNASAKEPPLHTESPYRPDHADAPATAPARVDARRRKMSPMRRQIAAHMMRSRRTSAHVTTVVEVDMSAVGRRREELGAQYGARGISLTYLAFVAGATVASLREHPALNASLDGDEIVYHEDVNLGIAVALEGGLIVPVMHRAQHLSLEGLAAKIGDLSSRARSNRLSPDEVQGGTFTITNPGRFGTVLATPIINQPQVGILDLEAVVKRPVVVEAPDGDSIAIRPITNLCLSFDHRALDGAEAARFLGSVKSRLEGWTADG